MSTRSMTHSKQRSRQDGGGYCGESSTAVTVRQSPTNRRRTAAVPRPCVLPHNFLVFLLFFLPLLSLTLLGFFPLQLSLDCARVLLPLPIAAQSVNETPCPLTISNWHTQIAVCAGTR